MKNQSKKPALTHTDEFALIVDLDAIDQKLGSIKWQVTDAKPKNVNALAHKIATIREKLAEIETAIKPANSYWSDYLNRYITVPQEDAE